MGDELQNYLLQLQQVEAALLSDSNNRELLKLKEDLEEVINLSRDLKSQVESNESSSSSHQNVQKNNQSRNSEPLAQPYVIPEKVYGQSGKKHHVIAKIWKVGDHCLAKWAENSQFYEAIIDSITDDGVVSVTFLAYRNRSTTTVDELKELVEKPFENENTKKKYLKLNQREYLKKKKLKKQQRFKEIEAEREVEKNKWIAFTSKATKKGFKTKSIFVSPDNINGRVGIGTCGMSGKPMTEFTPSEKWRKP